MFPLRDEYESLTKAAKADLKGPGVSDALARLAAKGLKFLRGCKRKALTSKVPGKAYFAFDSKGTLSRPVNEALFDAGLAEADLRKALAGKMATLEHEARAKVLYSATMAYCATTDLTKSNDKKSPGTVFECLVGHLVALAFGVNPASQVEVPVAGDFLHSLPTDFVFDLGPGNNRIHLPVKISTRERVVQVWAHQRVLDGLFGMNRFKGLLVCLTETNKQKDEAVVEVCLPGQWAVYQMHIAQLYRVYYLDVPEKYRPLAERYPFIQVKSFASFFDEVDSLRKASS